MTKPTNYQIEQFRNYLINQGHPSTTIDSYISDVNQYFAQYSSLSRNDILEFKSQFKEANTINRKLTSLKQYNEYLLTNNQVDALYVIKSDYVKKQKSGNPLNVTDKEIEKFYKKVNESNNLRDIAIIYLIANTGIRREETTNIKLSDLNLNKGELIVYGGKGNKQREIMLNDMVIKHLKKYIAYRNGVRESGRLNFKYSKESEYLFVSERAIKLHKNTINDIFALYDGKNITPHQLRHYFATIALETKALDIIQLQNVLGHKDINTTTIYAHPRKETIKKNMNKISIG